MTTGNEIDYVTDFIALDEPDGTRSVAKLVEEAETNGYANMTDKEIEKLMQYREHIAQSNTIVKNALLKQQKEAEMRAEHLARQEEYTNSVLSTLTGVVPEFAVVTGNEVE